MKLRRNNLFFIFCIRSFPELVFLKNLLEVPLWNSGNLRCLHKIQCKAFLKYVNVLLFGNADHGLSRPFFYSCIFLSVTLNIIWMYLLQGFSLLKRVKDPQYWRGPTQCFRYNPLSSTHYFIHSGNTNPYHNKFCLVLPDQSLYASVTMMVGAIGFLVVTDKNWQICSQSSFSWRILLEVPLWNSSIFRLTLSWAYRSIC